MLYKLRNTVKHYDWGSPDYIPRLLGLDNRGGEPWAELWMGVHPGGPSRVLWGKEEILLSGLIAENPALYLGGEAAERFGGLPFLFKLLAAGKPLSIQAHPNLEQAREGFERENRAGLAPGAPDRNYRDPNHKPEIVCAITPFTALCGFREPGEIEDLFRAVLGSAPRRLLDSLGPLEEALAIPAPKEALRSFLAALFALPKAAAGELGAFLMDSKGAEAPAGSAARTAGSWAARFAALYPGDPSVIAPLYLNLVTLEPGEAIFLPAGVLHAYMEGFAVELMANSDNVLRGGLTGKHMDIPELMRVLDFSPGKPRILTADPLSGRYAAPCLEFSLRTLRGGDGIRRREQGPSIIVVTEGAPRLSSGETLPGGNSIFVPSGNTASLEGDFTAFAASIPAAAPAAP
ncbi:MAG: mannose-6-phosphate isomerase, class I [Treponema sp.]|jgi:mannose-6-phosphate isomerase|nr:mannose-6-phosphate isomerase, class I [Treponema sp.]